MPKISIILPVYNGSKYLKKTIESIINQTFKDFELIIINDGSTDDCDDICKEFQKRDNRIIYRYQQNKGISFTRNIGMEMARADWITFCDHDDLYEPNLLEENYKLIKDKDIDFLKFGRKMIQGDMVSSTIFGVDTPTIICKDQIEKYYLELTEAPLLLYTWDGLFSKKFLNNNDIKYNNNMKAGEEDRNFMFDCIKCFNTMIINPKIYYNHFLRIGSSTSSRFSMNRCESIEFSLQNERLLLIDILKVSNFDIIYQNRLMYYLKIYIDNLLKGTNSNLSKGQQINYLKQFINKHNVLNILKLSKQYSFKNKIILILCHFNLYSVLLRVLFYRKYFRINKGKFGDE